MISFVIRSSHVNTQLQNVALFKLYPNGRILDIVEKAKTILYIVAGISDLMERKTKLPVTENINK